MQIDLILILPLLVLFAALGLLLWWRLHRKPRPEYTWGEPMAPEPEPEPEPPEAEPETGLAMQMVEEPEPEPEPIAEAQAPEPEPVAPRRPAWQYKRPATTLKHRTQAQRDWWKQHRNSEMGARALHMRSLQEIMDLDRQIDNANR